MRHPGCAVCGGTGFVEVQDFYEDGSPARSVSIEPCACQIENIQHRPAGSVGAVHRSNADIAEITRLTARIAELEKALKKIEGGSFPGATEMALTGNWKGIVAKLQEIARSTLERNAQPAQEIEG